jgi:hypothetical protein
MRALLFTALLALPLPAHAEEILRGPYPFLRDNELSVHGGYAAGFGDTFGGPKASIDYGYKLGGSLWLDLAGGFLSGVCPHESGTTCVGEGDAAEVLGGIKWKLRMNVPVVPYAKIVGGFAYLFPDGARSGVGVVLRGGIGAHYFFYEWIGVGLEITGALGHAGYQDAVGLSRTLSGIDAVGGAELAF